MLNCRDMTKLISDSLERKVTWRQRMEIRMHILMCALCRRFRSDTLTLKKRVKDETIRQKSTTYVERNLTNRMPDETRERLRTLLQRARR